MENPMQKAHNLKEIIRYFDSQTPLTPEDAEQWQAFYTETKRNEIDHIITALVSSPIGHKILFGGHPGNGKSTELNKLVCDPRIKQQFAVIKFDAKELLDVNDIDITELLLVISLKILEFADVRNIKLDDYFKKRFDDLEGFFRKKMKVEEVRTRFRQSSMGAEAKISLGAKIPLVKLGSNFYAKIRGQHEFREIVRETYRPRLTELTDLVNDLLIDISEKNRPHDILLIVDGLDRTPLKPARKLYAEDGHHLSKIRNASLLLTVPIPLIHSTSAALIQGELGPITTLKNVRIKTRTRQVDEKTKTNIAILEDAVRKRIEDQSLITSEALTMAVQYSGGVFRTLIDLIYQAAIKSAVLDGKQIGLKDMQDAVNEARINQKRPLTRSHWEMLLEIDDHKKFLTDGDEERLELLRGLYALEYINGEEGCEVSPLLQDAVEEYRKEFKSTSKQD
jgi:DNA polymerase III delta prime subunit